MNGLLCLADVVHGDLGEAQVGEALQPRRVLGEVAGHQDHVPDLCLAHLLAHHVEVLDGLQVPADGGWNTLPRHWSCASAIASASVGAHDTCTCSRSGPGPPASR
jgi:hypothetical protein